MLYKSNYTFKGLKEDKIFEKGKPVDVTVERAKEIEKNIQAIKGYEDFKLTRIEGEKKKKA